MCTLTFVPTEDGYLAGMNRDELFSRPIALPPKIFGKGAMEMVYPEESSGGTWIACNGRGNLLALLNWNGSKSHNLGEKRRTRGLVIPELASELDSLATDSHFRRMNLHGMFPFRWLGFSGAKGSLTSGAGTAWRDGNWYSPGLANIGFHQVSQIHWRQKSGD